ncbi:hypothetical protein V8C34DRAFT_268203 [Trichoderma compactum]
MMYMYTRYGAPKLASEGGRCYRALGPLRPTSRREPTIDAFPQPCSQSFFSPQRAQPRGSEKLESGDPVACAQAPALFQCQPRECQAKPRLAGFSEAIRFHSFLRYLCHEHDVDLPLVGTNEPNFQFCCANQMDDRASLTKKQILYSLMFGTPILSQGLFLWMVPHKGNTLGCLSDCSLDSWHDHAAKTRHPASGNNLGAIVDRDPSPVPGVQ